MKGFVADALAHLGATVTPAEGGRLAVELPAEPEGVTAELGARLGRGSFELAFGAEDLVPGAELVAPGSHLLRVLEELLGPRGLRCYVVQPASGRLTLKRVAAAGLEPARGLVFSLGDKEQLEGLDLYVVYRLRYLTRERLDALETVRVALRPGREPEAEVAEPPPTAGDWEVRPRKRAPQEQLQTGLALADQVLAERARGEARRLSKEARRRLGKDATRLHAYYSGQIAEYERKNRRRDLALLRIEELEEERALRLRELVAATCVSVEAEPLQLLEVEVPLQRATLRVWARDAAAREGAPVGEAQLLLDRHLDELWVPPCPACQGTLTSDRLAGCGSGHLVHQACLTPCPACQTPRCGACDQRACGTCQRALCASCVSECPGCGAGVCAEHRGVCARCEQVGCGSCLQACAGCGQLACRQHRREAGEGTAASFCEACATPCAACRTATPRQDLRRCGTCGRRFCADCHPREASACTLCLGA